MKSIKWSAFILITLITASCKPSAHDEEKINVKDTTVSTIIITPSAIRLFGQSILDNKVQPSDNENTFACLDSLDDDNQETRTFFFSVYRIIAKKSDGALGEVVGSYTKSYFQLFPEEAFNHYKQFDKTEQELFINNIAYEFYASGTDYAQDIENYFTEIGKSCPNCMADENFISIKKELLNNVAKMNE
jgi:hypothetical protein